MTVAVVNENYEHHWSADILPERPMILPGRHYTYPAQADEIESGALEVLVRPGPSSGSQGDPLGGQPFLATCALGFRDASVPTGVWANSFSATPP